jgi:phosphopantetheinyl transferase
MKYYFYECNEPDIKKQRALARCLFKSVSGVDYVKDERGKPHFPKSSDSDLHMSISHCKGGIAFIIADEPVGIDVEEISRMNLKISRRICTENELKLLENAEDNQELLCKLWVLKEAYSKLTGKGLSQGFNTIETAGNDKLLTIKRGDVYIGIATSSGFSDSRGQSICRLTDSSASLL